MTAQRQPTPDQLQRLVRYAERHGRDWKSHLTLDWSTGKDVSQPDGHLLRQVRNQMGPAWLAKFQLPAKETM